ncbi:SLC35F6 family protein [Megaselia abdita]
MNGLKEAPTVLLLSGTCAVLLLYSCTTISLNGKPFQHPILLTLVIFLGESMNLGIYSIFKKVRENRMEGTGNTHILTYGEVLQYKHSTLFAIGTLDSISNIILITGLGITYPTVFILSCLSSLIFVHLLAYLYRENHGKTHQCIGLILISIGIFSTCIYRIFAFDDWDRNKVMTGILLIIFGSCMKSVSLVISDHNFKSLNNPALSVTGIKALYGFLMTVLYYVLFSFFKFFPPFQPYLDNIKDIPAEIENYPGIVFALIGLCLLSTFYEASASILTKNEKPEKKIAFDAVRVILVSFAAIMFEWEPQSIFFLGSGILTLFGLFVYADSTLLIKVYKAIFIRPRRTVFNEDDATNITQSSPAETA